MPFCSHCGTQLAENASFCHVCGSSVVSAGGKKTQQSFMVEGIPRVVVSTRVPGSMGISHAPSESEVSVGIALKESQYIDWNISQNGDLIAVSLRPKNGYFEFPGGFTVQGVRADVSVRVPKQSVLDLANKWGEISVSGIEGNSITAESSVGSMHIAGFTGTAEVKTRTGLLNLERVSGRVSARNLAGSISYTGRVAGDSSFTTKVGNIDVTLLGELDLRIDASSRVGTVSIDPSIRGSNLQSDLYGLGNHVTCALGRGAHRLVVETTTGSASIHHSPVV